MADNIFVYLGGEQEVPEDVTHVVIDRSVKIIPRLAFYYRTNLVSVKMHDGIEIIEQKAFKGCYILRGIKLPGVRVVEKYAFDYCTRLSDLQFGDKLETIEDGAFVGCSLRSITIPTVRTIGCRAFAYCDQLTDLELPSVEIIGIGAFSRCSHLQRIAIPLKDNMFPHHPCLQKYVQFNECENLTMVALVGIEAIHKTISSLLLECWRDEMNQEIDRINLVLPNTPVNEKTDVIQEWIESVIRRMEHYKAEHNRLLKKATTLLELALWKAKLDESERDTPNGKAAKNTDVGSVRKELRIISGADIIIKNVLPFLQLG